jgi:hypothetical protein
MKNILVLIGLMLFMTAFSQESYNRVSEIDTLRNHRAGASNTAEGYMRDFVKNYGMPNLQIVLLKVEDGTLDKYMTSITDNKYLESIKDIRYMFKSLYCFVSNGKFYLMTYEPLRGENTERNIYLYCRDADGWTPEILIRKDYHRGTNYMKFLSFVRHKHIYEPKANTMSNDSIEFNFDTLIEKNGISYHYNSYIIFISINGKIKFNYSENGGSDSFYKDNRN